MENKNIENTFIVENCNWNTTIETFVKQIGEKSNGYKAMHVRCAESHQQSYDILMYITIFLGPMAGVISALEFQISPCGDFFSVAITIVSFLAGLTAVIVKYTKYNEKSYAHKMAASRYTSLEHNIRQQLSLNRLNRINAGTYEKWISRSYNDLFDSSPLINTKIYEKWIKYAKEKGMSLPDEYGTLVEINTDDKITQLINMKNININRSLHDVIIKSNDEETEIKEEIKEDFKEEEKYLKGDSSKNSPPSVFDDLQKRQSSSEEISKTFEFIVSPDQKKRTIKRKEDFSLYGDFNKYGKDQMKYQMCRLMNF